MAILLCAAKNAIDRDERRVEARDLIAVSPVNVGPVADRSARRRSPTVRACAVSNH
jgi:hypothetical protein